MKAGTFLASAFLLSFSAAVAGETKDSASNQAGVVKPQVPSMEQNHLEGGTRWRFKPSCVALPLTPIPPGTVSPWVKEIDEKIVQAWYQSKKLRGKGRVSCEFDISPYGEIQNLRAFTGQKNDPALLSDAFEIVKQVGPLGPFSYTRSSDGQLTLVVVFNEYPSCLVYEIQRHASQMVHRLK